MPKSLSTAHVTGPVLTRREKSLKALHCKVSRGWKKRKRKPRCAEPEPKACVLTCLARSLEFCLPRFGTIPPPGIHDEPRRSLVGDVGPSPDRKHGDFVAKADQEMNVNE